MQFCWRSTDNTNKLLECLREYFAMHGIPEELSRDGGSTYMSYAAQKFLSDYGVRHRVSSVAYPHSNQRAELAVKSMKRLIRENTNPDGSLNNDRFLRAVMNYRNTPDRDTERSHAQVIFCRNLRDFLPASLRRYKPQPEWVLLREDWEKALRKRALRNMEQLTPGTRHLPPLQVHDSVQVQNQLGKNPSRWDITGTVVEVKNHDQYVIRVHGSGRLKTRTRKFLKKIVPYASDYHSSTPTPVIAGDPPTPSIDDPIQEQPTPITPNTLGLEEDLSVDQPKHEVQLPGQPGQGEPVELRRSSRVRQVPKRLNIETTKGQSYESEKVSTACMSVSVHTTSFQSGLLGEGGINDNGRRLTSIFTGATGKGPAGW